MKINIVYLLLIALLGIIVSASIAQQNQNTLQQEVEALQKRVSELEGKLQTVENVEKMELAAKLINSEFGKFERELRNSNDKWLWGWTTFFVGIAAIVVTVIGLALWFYVKSLIADRVEKDIDEFKEAVGNLNKINNQLVILEEGYTYTVLQGFDESYFRNQDLDFKEIKALREETLLRILEDNTYPLAIRFRTVGVLADRKSPELVTPTLKLLNAVVDSDLSSDLYNDSKLETEHAMLHLVSFVGKIHTQETYEGLKKFLISLITDNPKNKDIFLTQIAFTLFWISFKLNIGDSVSVLRLAIPHLKVGQSDLQALQNFAKYFDIFNNPEGIKEILNIHAKDKMPELEEECLELLEKYDANFVKEWKEKKEDTNTESEESDESKPTN